MDIIFSLDSVITAIGMVEPDKLWVMITAIIIAVGVMLVFASGRTLFFVDVEGSAAQMQIVGGK